ncbi:hypothetical protein D3C80_1960190 [compost metagenome]
MDGAQVFETQGLADQWVDRHLLLVQAKGVLHRSLQARRHLVQGTAGQLDHQCRALNCGFGSLSALAFDLEPHAWPPM